ncbi:hypothetical protein FOCC_FOCC012726 [Frankliniella occidentalis]|nr:hypothetical protein FOCC_FOCC012726 [Frankliniella occidentalis]
MNSIFPINEHTELVSYEARKSAVRTSPSTNVVIAAYTTAQARIILHRYLATLEQNALIILGTQDVKFHTEEDRKRPVSESLCQTPMREVPRRLLTPLFLGEAKPSCIEPSARETHSPPAGESLPSSCSSSLSPDSATSSTDSQQTMFRTSPLTPGTDGYRWYTEATRWCHSVVLNSAVVKKKKPHYTALLDMTVPLNASKSKRVVIRVDLDRGCSRYGAYAIAAQRAFGSTTPDFGAVVGGVAVGWQDGRQIFNLVTKKHDTDIPTLWAIRESLYALSRLCYMHGVRDICSPALASGLDTHNWVIIREMLHEIFWNCDINIHVYYLVFENLRDAKPGVKHKCGEAFFGVCRKTVTTIDHVCYMRRRQTLLQKRDAAKEKYRGKMLEKGGMTSAQIEKAVHMQFSDYSDDDEEDCGAGQGGSFCLELHLAAIAPCPKLFLADGTEGTCPRQELCLYSHDVLPRGGGPPISKCRGAAQDDGFLKNDDRLHIVGPVPADLDEMFGWFRHRMRALGNKFPVLNLVLHSRMREVMGAKFLRIPGNSAPPEEAARVSRDRLLKNHFREEGPGSGTHPGNKGGVAPAGRVNLPGETLEDWMTRRIKMQSLFVPKNKDDAMCLARCIKYFEKYHTSIKHGAGRLSMPRNGDMLKDSIASCDLAGVNTNKLGGFNKIFNFQAVLPKYRLVVFLDKKCKEVYFNGSPRDENGVKKGRHM